MSVTRSAVVYARISQDKGDTLAGVEAQVTDAIEYIKTLPGVERNAQIDGSPKYRKHPERGHWPPGVLVDDDISASRGDLEKRPEYTRLINYTRGGDIQIIVCLAQDRLWRNLKQAADGMEAIKDSDVRLVFTKTKEELDLAESGTKFRAGLMSLLASWFADDISDKQRDRARQAAETGAYHGARPFGFTLMHYNVPPSELGQARTDFSVHEPQKEVAGSEVRCPGCDGRKSGKSRTIIPHPEEAQALREIYELAAYIPDVTERGGTAMTPYKICLYLDGHEITGPAGVPISRPAIPTASGKRWEEVGVQSLLLILRAKRNIGIREWSAKWDGGKRVPGTLIKGNWAGIVDEPLYDTVQRLLGKRAKVRPGGNAPAHLLITYSFGGLCGHPLAIHRVNGKRRYRCRGVWRSDGQCVNFEAGPAEAEVERHLFKWLDKNTVLAKQLEHTGNADLNKLHDKRKKLKGQMEGIEAKFGDNAYDRDDPAENEAIYKRLKQAKKKLITEIGREIDVLLDSGAATPGANRESFPTGGGFRTLWKNATVEEKIGIARRFIDRVDIYPAGSGNAPDPRLIRIHPGSWATGIDGAQPARRPDPESFSSKGKILAFLREHPGEWFTRADISEATGVPPTGVHKALTYALGPAGEVSMEWRRRGGQRACNVYSGASGASWGARTRKAPGGAIGARETIRAWMETPPRDKRWFTAAEIGAGSGAGSAAHVTRVVNELVTAGFIQQRRSPRAHSNLRYQYSINGR